MKKGRIDGLTLYERLAKSQGAQPRIKVEINLTDFEFQPIIDAIQIRGQFGLKYSDGAGVALFDCDELVVVDNYGGETNVIKSIDAEGFLNTIKLYLINHREIITPQAVADYVNGKNKIILLN